MDKNQFPLVKCFEILQGSFDRNTKVRFEFGCNVL